MVTYGVIGLLGAGFFMLALNWLERDYSNQTISKLQLDLETERGKTATLKETIELKESDRRRLQDAIDQGKQRERELQSRLETRKATQELLALFLREC